MSSQHRIINGGRPGLPAGLPTPDSQVTIYGGEYSLGQRRENMDALATPTAAPPVLYGAPAPPGDLLPWSWAEQQLVTARTYWIATTRPDGRPHCRPVWGVWLPDGFWFSTAPWPGPTCSPTRRSPCTWRAATKW